MVLKIGTMFGDVAESFVREPATQRYPFERRETPERLRGKLLWDPEACVGCGLCSRECPSDALELIVLDKKEKRFVLRYDVGRCIFCSQCVVNCRFGCLEMASDRWELAAAAKNAFVEYYGEEADIREALGLDDLAKGDGEGGG